MSVRFSKKIIGELCDRAAEVIGVDADARTVELAFSSEAEISRSYGIEILSHTPSACDLTRLNDGGAVLTNHEWGRQVGVIEKAWIGSDYIGRARVRFSRTSDGQDVFQDIIDGVRRHVSVGYKVDEIKYISERDGIDVYLVTRWTPHEISIVSVPADTSVGVGRSAAPAVNPIKNTRNLKSMPSVTQEKTGRPSLVTAVRALLADVANASSARAHTPAGFQEPTAFIPTGTARSIIATLSREYLPGLFDANGRLRRSPQASASGVEFRASSAVITNSRVARAGAGVVLIPEATIAHAVGRTGTVALETVPGFVRHVDAAPFATIDVDSLAEVDLSALPIASVNIDLNNMIGKAVRFEVTRRERMSYGEKEELVEQILSSIAMGLARAADATLMDALSAATLAPFTLADAAAQDLEFDSLRALVGRDAVGAAVGQDGVLRAAGVPAALTADMAGTIVGAWDRAAVALRDDITIYAERTGTQGRMTITCWASMQACIPAPGKFFELVA
jgi:HK97 family phage prohead protease